MGRKIDVGAGVYQQGPIPRMLDLARHAEGLGFHNLGFNDNQCGSRELMLTLGAAATSTLRIRIGSAVANPVTRHVTVLASAMYSLQELAGDRVYLGLGRGELSVSLIGAKRAPLQQLATTIASLRALWAGETVTVDGYTTRLAYAQGKPRSIPIYVAASAPRVLELAGQLADGVMISAGAHPPYIKAAAEQARRAAEAAGRESASLRLIARMACVVSDDQADWRAAATHVAMTAVRPSASTFDDEDREAAERIRGSYSAAGHLEVETDYTKHVTNRLLGKLALVGSALEVRDRVAELASLGLDQIDIIPCGPEPARVLEAFAQGVF